MLALLSADQEERQADIARHRALMELIEDDEADTKQCRIVDKPCRQHPLGDDHDPGTRSDRPVIAGDPADGLARVFAEQTSHAACRAACGHAAGLEHHDRPTVQPRLVEQAKGHDRRLTRTGFSCQHGLSGVGERGPDFLDAVLDRKVSARQGHDRIMPADRVVARARSELCESQERESPSRRRHI